jgi:hypothetical protein
MNNEKLSDAEGKEILRKWPEKTNAWGNSDTKFIRAQPKSNQKSAPGPRIISPGLVLFKTQPDGMYVKFNNLEYCDLICIEICGTISNLNDKRSRYILSSRSLILECSKKWLYEEISTSGNGTESRLKNQGIEENQISHLNYFDNIDIPIRFLRVLYSIPNKNYNEWIEFHSPSGYEYFCRHSSLSSFNSQKMQNFLFGMSRESHFYT